MVIIGMKWPCRQSSLAVRRMRMAYAPNVPEKILNVSINLKLLKVHFIVHNSEQIQKVIIHADF